MPIFLCYGEGMKTVFVLPIIFTADCCCVLLQIVCLLLPSLAFSSGSDGSKRTRCCCCPQKRLFCGKCTRHCRHQNTLIFGNTVRHHLEQPVMAYSILRNKNRHLHGKRCPFEILFTALPLRMAGLRVRNLSRHSGKSPQKRLLPFCAVLTTHQKPSDAPDQAYFDLVLVPRVP